MATVSTFVAEYFGECDACGGNLKGHECTFDTFDKIVHVRCPDSEVDAPKGVPLCQRCFTYHNGECL